MISAPQGLKWAASAVFLTVPMAAVQSVVMARAPWWALPLKSMELAAIWAFGGSVLLALALVQARRSLLPPLYVIGAIWVVLSAFAAVRTRNPSMGFFTIFLGVYFALLTSWARHEFTRSFFDPDMKWFEGAPHPIPTLQCEVGPEDSKIDFKVSRLDLEGTFLFASNPGSLKQAGLGQGKGSKPAELVFRFRDKEVRCQGKPMLLFKRNSEGVGFRFDGNTPDQKKMLGDFIETLRGEGYV